jgi:hypothetical protein
MNCSRFKSIAALALIFLSLVAIPSVECANNKKSSSGSAVHEPTIEEVNAKQLERILADKDYVAVYWCKSPERAVPPHRVGLQCSGTILVKIRLSKELKGKEKSFK